MRSRCPSPCFFASCLLAFPLCASLTAFFRSCVGAFLHSRFVHSCLTRFAFLLHPSRLDVGVHFMVEHRGCS